MTTNVKQTVTLEQEKFFGRGFGWDSVRIRMGFLYSHSFRIRMGFLYSQRRQNSNDSEHYFLHISSKVMQKIQKIDFQTVHSRRGSIKSETM